MATTQTVQRTPAERWMPCSIVDLSLWLVNLGNANWLLFLWFGNSIHDRHWAPEREGAHWGCSLLPTRRCIMVACIRLLHSDRLITADSVVRFSGCSTWALLNLRSLLLEKEESEKKQFFTTWTFNWSDAWQNQKWTYGGTYDWSLHWAQNWSLKSFESKLLSPDQNWWPNAWLSFGPFNRLATSVLTSAYNLLVNQAGQSNGTVRQWHFQIQFLNVNIWNFFNIM